MLCSARPGLVWVDFLKDLHTSALVVTHGQGSWAGGDRSPVLWRDSCTVFSSSWRKDDTFFPGLPVLCSLGWLLVRLGLG